MTHLRAAVDAIEKACKELEQVDEKLLPRVEYYTLLEALWTCAQATQAIICDENRKRKEREACTAETTKKSL